MKHTTVITAAALCLLAILITANTSEAQSKSVRSGASLDVVAGRGQSEVTVENTLSGPVKIFINGRASGTVQGRGTELIVVSDGNHSISAQSVVRSGGTSREVRFSAQGQRVLFRTTAPNATTLSLSREGIYELAALKPASQDEGHGAAPATRRQGRGSGAPGHDNDGKAEATAAPAAAPASAAQP